ncbi:LppX_LprAFG lipoprotein [Streptomyces sp. NPDC046909]|uniref:LppX_LprAFG lipoprotein n=1 Tax=Streptomyces sp. NPDC046909 TaxID=3155617 RepID=UPI0033FDE769
MRSAVRAAVPLAALLLAGCGAGSGAGESSGTSAADAVARAAEKSQDVTSVHYRATGRIPETGRVSTEAQVSVEPSRARVTTVQSGTSAGRMEFRLVDGVLYENVADKDVKEVGGRHWVSFGPTAKFTAGGGLKMDVTLLRDQAARNPARDAAFLAAADDVRRDGTEKVDGAATTHYTGTATLDALRGWLKEQKKATRTRLGPGLDEYDRLEVDELTLDVWIGGDDRVKQLRTQGMGRHGELDLTTVLSYGKPVTVRAPAADDTVDLRKRAKDTAR